MNERIKELDVQATSRFQELDPGAGEERGIRKLTKWQRSGNETSAKRGKYGFRLT